MSCGLTLDRQERERGKSPLGRLWQLAPCSVILGTGARSSRWGMNATPIGDKGPVCTGLAAAGGGGLLHLLRAEPLIGRQCPLLASGRDARAIRDDDRPRAQQPWGRLRVPSQAKPGWEQSRWMSMSLWPQSFSRNSSVGPLKPLLWSAVSAVDETLEKRLVEARAGGALRRRGTAPGWAVRCGMLLPEGTPRDPGGPESGSEVRRAR